MRSIVFAVALALFAAEAQADQAGMWDVEGFGIYNSCAVAWPSEFSGTIKVTRVKGKPKQLKIKRSDGIVMTAKQSNTSLFAGAVVDFPSSGECISSVSYKISEIANGIGNFRMINSTACDNGLTCSSVGVGTARKR